MQLRPYQEQMLVALREKFKQGKRSVVLYAPTGAGKTEMAIALLNAAREKNNRSAMILDRIVLVNQTSERLDNYSIDHGVLQSGHARFRPYEYIQVCSAQTLERRGSMVDVALLIVDECHATRKQTVEFIKNHPNVRVVGLSATPFTRSMGRVYEDIVSTVTTKQLVDQGVLTPLRVYIAKEIDMTGAKKVGGEWTSADATERGMKIVGDVVAEWVRKTYAIFGGPKKTIVFAAGVAHGIELARKFQEHGYRFLCVSYRDDEEFKTQVIEDFKRPDSTIHGLIATDILTKGFDCVAEGQMVLTDCGLVAIDQLSVKHKVWDGHEYVSHSGAIYKGERDVITYAGLTATPDHLVKTAKGWRTLGECAAKQMAIIKTGDGRNAICEHENRFAGGQEGFFSWDEFTANNPEILQKVRQTKRRVWDVLNAGPRNCFTCEGLLIHNCPDVAIGISARPFSKSLSSHIQQLGRVTRGAPGKDQAIWLCFSGNYLRFREDWDKVYAEGVHALNDDKERPKKEKTPEEKAESKCPKCEALWERGWRSCGYCGYMRERPTVVTSVPGELHELQSASREDRQKWWSMCRYKVAIEGWSSGRAAHTYHERFGVWPRGLNDDQYLVPDEEFDKFTKEQLKKYLRKVHAIRSKRK